MPNTLTLTFILSSLIITFFQGIFNQRRFAPNGVKSDDDDDDDDDGDNDDDDDDDDGGGGVFLTKLFC